jgi:flagellar basal body rod protein FlgG
MLPGLYSAATALDVATVNQDVIAHNLAHVNVPGFRRSVLSFSAFETALQNALRDANRLGTQVDTVQTDFSPGHLEQTERPLDVAMLDDGFFVLNGPDGPLYTRNGVFALTADGRLVSMDGVPVQGRGGPITLPPGTSEAQVTISKDGTVVVNGQPTDQLRLVRFADVQQLIPAGTTSFRAPTGAAPLPYDGVVMQGARESSNVVAVEELVRMIGGLRYFEASQRALRTIAEAVQHTTDPRGQ